jgi:transcriptional regulator with XRE-family HTH domain
MADKGVSPVGDKLREWRQRRRLSQLELAVDADISSQHLSFVETGRSLPSREMILNLAERMNIPICDRNVILVTGGYAPIFPERPLADPALRTARDFIGRILESFWPSPAFAIDRHYNILASNGALPQMFDGVAGWLQQPPSNALRISLHPEGLAPRIVNLPEWRHHLLARLRTQIDMTADTALAGLLKELSAYPCPIMLERKGAAVQADIAIPLRLRIGNDELCFLSTTMIFGAPLDITLSELAIEALIPADPDTATLVARLSAPKPVSLPRA